MSMNLRMLWVALFASSGALAGENPPQPLAPLPLGWSLMGNGGPQALPGSCEIGVDSQKSVEAPQYSVRCTSTVLPSFGGARESVESMRHRGKRVRVSAWLMVSGVESVPNAQYPGAVGEAGLWIGVGSARNGLRTDRMPDRTMKGSTGWEQRDFVVDVPEDSTQLSVGFWMQGKGQVWMRDVKVEEVASTVPVNFTPNDQREKGPDLSLLAVASAADRFQPPPAKWLAMGATGFELCDVGVDTQLLRTGQRNLSIACSIPQNAVLRQAAEAVPYWGKRVRFSGWIRTKDVEPPAGGESGGATLYFGATATNTPTLSVRITGTTEWQYRELIMDIPRGSAYMPLGISLTGSGQVWARDLKFEEVSSDVPVTPPGIGAR